MGNAPSAQPKTGGTTFRDRVEKLRLASDAFVGLTASRSREPDGTPRARLRGFFLTVAWPLRRLQGIEQFAGAFCD